jgi:Uma2 family endonuclease
MVIVETLITAEQLLQMPAVEHCELIRGEIIKMWPTGLEHGRVANRISVRLGMFVEQRQLGIVTTAEAGFLVGRDPDTVLAPDVAFISAARVPNNRIPGFFDGTPDLAVEVLSPNDREGEVLKKSRNGSKPVAAWSGCSIPQPAPSRSITTFAMPRSSPRKTR